MAIRFETAYVNGIRLRVAVQKPGKALPGAPLILLVHGWPESWYSWRHQIPVLAEAGYRVAAMDLRGYGGSDSPPAIADYSMINMTNDVAGVAKYLDADKVILVGHDWGAPIVWVTAIRYPELVSAVVGMSVPHLRRGSRDITTIYRQIFRENFFYQLYFQTPGVAEAELEADIDTSLRKIYYAASGDCTKADRGFMGGNGEKTGMLDGMVNPDPFPDWMRQEDLDYFAEQFRQSGFRGSINRYRNFERDWRELPELSEKLVEQPALFIAGSRDPVLTYIPGKRLDQEMDGMYTNLRAKVIIEGGGHWIQQERPDEVNNALLAFLSGLRQASGVPAHQGLP